MKVVISYDRQGMKTTLAIICGSAVGLLFWGLVYYVCMERFK